MKIGGIARSSNSSLHNMLKQDKEDIAIVNLRHIQDQNQRHFRKIKSENEESQVSSVCFVLMKKVMTSTCDCDLIAT